MLVKENSSPLAAGIADTSTVALDRTTLLDAAGRAYPDEWCDIKNYPREWLEEHREEEIIRLASLDRTNPYLNRTWVEDRTPPEQDHSSRFNVLPYLRNRSLTDALEPFCGDFWEKHSDGLVVFCGRSCSHIEACSEAILKKHPGVDFLHIPFSKTRSYPSAFANEATIQTEATLAPHEEERIFHLLDKFIPDGEAIGNRKIYLVDYLSNSGLVLSSVMRFLAVWASSRERDDLSPDRLHAVCFIWEQKRCFSDGRLQPEGARPPEFITPYDGASSVVIGTVCNNEGVDLVSSYPHFEAQAFDKVPDPAFPRQAYKDYMDYLKWLKEIEGKC